MEFIWLRRGHGLVQRIWTRLDFGLIVDVRSAQTFQQVTNRERSGRQVCAEFINQDLIAAGYHRQSATVLRELKFLDPYVVTHVNGLSYQTHRAIPKVDHPSTCCYQSVSTRTQGAPIHKVTLRGAIKKIRKNLT